MYFNGYKPLICFTFQFEHIKSSKTPRILPNKQKQKNSLITLISFHDLQMFVELAA
jgi:hypothetical protein